MIRILLLALSILLLPARADAGIRAVYADSLGGSLEVAVNDRGDAVALTRDHRRIILKGDEAYIVEERLTGPLVTRAADLEALVKPAANARVSPLLQPLGTRVIGGRSGEAYGYAKSATNDRDFIFFVIGEDAEFRSLGHVMRRILEVQTVIARRDNTLPEEMRTDQVYDLLEKGAPLQFQGTPLFSLVSGPVADSEFALPAAPESRDMLVARLKSEAEEEKGPPSGDTMILRAVYADRQLWLLTDDGKLSSIAEGGDVRKPATLAKVADLCTGRAGLIALVQAASGDGWTLHVWNRDHWESGRAVARRGETAIALDCDSDTPLLLTDKRLVDLGGDKAVKLSGRLGGARVRASLHATPDWVYVGLNAGEWGGGLRRIDRRSGRIEIVEKKRTADLCEGPLNGDCDPVNGIATLPWRPDCVAAAIGLIHFMAHGRIVSVCPDGVEQLLSMPSDPYLTGKSAVEAANGGFGAVAFFGIVTSGDALVAAGHDGLYRITAPAKAERQPWPLFKRVGGVLVSFERPDVVLVMSELNRRASISGISPLLVPR